MQQEPMPPSDMQDVGVVRFLPWVGKRYSEGYLDGLKLLLLGESHYLRAESGDWRTKADPTFTRRVVQGIAVDGRHRYFTRLVRLVSDRDDVSAEVRAAFWERVAFYNYVQRFVGDGPRQRPAEEMYEEAEVALREVLERLDPDAVVVTGTGLWNRLPIQHRNEGTGWLPTAHGRAASAMYIEHPAAYGFSRKTWQPRVQEFLRSAIALRRNQPHARSLQCQAEAHEEISLLLDQLDRAYRKDAWCGASLREALTGIDHMRAASHPLVGSHSIWEIVLHAAGWKDTVRLRIGSALVLEPPRGDWPIPPAPTPESWASALAGLDAAHDALRETVAALPASQLVNVFLPEHVDRAVGGGVAAYATLHGIAQHDLYHAGQVMLLKKS